MSIHLAAWLFGQCIICREQGRFMVVCCRFLPDCHPAFAAENPSEAVRATGVMFNQRERQIQKSPEGF